MAITVLWDDGTQATWDEGDDWSRPGDPRAPFKILDEDRQPIAEVPDFGVRFVGDKPTLK